MSQIGQYPNSFYRVSLKAIIRNSAGEVLLVREKNHNDWNLPGGGLDHGEKEIDGLKRELFEEVGFSGDFSYRPIGIQPMYLTSKDALQLWVVYEIEPDNMNFSVGKESDEIKFVDPEQFKDSDKLSEQLIYKFCVDKNHPVDWQAWII